MSDETIEQTLIGNLNRNLTIDEKYNLLNKSLNNSNYKLINVNTRISDIAVLSNDYLLTANYDQSNLTLFNKNFELIKTINKFSNQITNNMMRAKIYPLCLAVNNRKKEIYITDYSLHKIYIVDFEFNLLFTINANGVKGTFNGQFQYPFGIMYNQCNNFIYICDKGNKRVQVFSTCNEADVSRYEFIRLHQLDYEPYQIKQLNQLACITTYSKFYFYDITTFQLKINYRHHYGIICNLFGKYFIEYDFKLRKIFCFNENGSLIDEFNSKLFDHNQLNEQNINNNEIIVDNGWENLIYFNNKLVITSEKLGKFIVV